MNSLQKIWNLLVSVLGSIFLITTGFVIFFFGGAIISAILFVAGMILIVALVAYGIYEYLTDGKEKDPQ